MILMLASDVNTILKNTLKAINPYKLLNSIINYKNDNCLLVQGRKYDLQHNLKLIAAGKAVGGMVRAVQDLLGDHIISGIVSLPSGYRDAFGTDQYLYPLHSSMINVYEGGLGNLPDASSLLASRAIHQLAKSANSSDLVVVLLSGGASALTSLPPREITIAEKRSICSLLSRRGASINELNTVRKHLSLLKGGKLATLCRPAEVLTFVLSDVIGDPLDIIASGPCYPDSSSPADLLTIFRKYDLFSSLSNSCAEFVSQFADKQDPSIPIPYITPQHVIVGNNEVALDASLQSAIALEYWSKIWSVRISGDVSDVSAFYSAITLTSVLDIYSKGQLWNIRRDVIEKCLQILGVKETKNVEDLYNSYLEIPSSEGNTRVCLLSGGEPVVVVRRDGKGGRNQELVLRVGINLDILYENLSRIVDGLVDCGKFKKFWTSISILFASLGTDGQDGPTPAAGAMVSQNFMRDNEQKRYLIHESLAHNDSFNVFASLGSQVYHIQTGITATNVMDIHILLINTRTFLQNN